MPTVAPANEQPVETTHLTDLMNRRQLLASAMAAASMASGVVRAEPGAVSGGGAQDLDLSAAAAAIRKGEITSESYATQLLDRAANFQDLKAFITIDRAAVLEAARSADKARAAGRSAPLLGLPIGVKDSYLTRGMPTTIGTSVLKDYKPDHDATVVTTIKRAGGIVFGKNNLAEMSYSLTGVNDHYGQPLNPHDRARITGGSSSGAAASVAARIVPAALGGDTVGSIRVPASLCGIVGYKPTPGRWPSRGTAPISQTLDTIGVLARSVADCVLLDSVVARTTSPRLTGQKGLKGTRLAYAPQLLEGLDPGVETTFAETRRKLRDAGAALVEIDLGSDFNALVERVTWPIFFHETMPEVRAFLAANGIPVSFEQIVEGLGKNFKPVWTQFILPTGANYVKDDVYKAVMNMHRPALQRRYGSLVFNRADALLFPTTPCAAPTIEDQFKFTVAGREVDRRFLGRNTTPGSGAGLPGVSLPMGMSPDLLPYGLELDGPAGGDVKLLALAHRVEQVLEISPVPRNI